MILSAPSCVRASNSVASSTPTCTPSASSAAASATSSLMMSVEPWRRQASRNAAACSRRVRSSACLFRYCSRRAPAASTVSTLATSNAVSAMSGVTAYSPLIGCIGGFVLACPEQSIGDVLTHAGPERGFEGLPRVFLRIFYRVADAQSIGDRRRDRRRERAAGTVVAAGEPFPAVGAHHAVLSVQRIDDLGGIFMRARDQHVFATHREQAPRALCEIHVVLAFFLHEPARFYAVGSNDGRLRYQQFAQRRNHLVGHQFVAAAGREYRIEHQRNLRIIGHHFRDRGNILGAAE